MDGMDTPLELVQERIDDIPLILAMMQQMGLVEVLDRHVGNHGNHQGLSNGWLAALWIAYIVSEGDHRKSAVATWTQQRVESLSRLTGQDLRDVELGEDRLGRLLTRLSVPERWKGIEEDLWQATAMAYAWEPQRIRLDSTTTFGYHARKEDGLMQLGHSKDYRPDKPQLKLMAAVAEPMGQMIAGSVHPGQTADDGLYVPMVERVRTITGRSGLLYIGDSKMSALATRSAIEAGGDQYLCRLPKPKRLAEWVDGALGDGTVLRSVLDDTGEVIAEGYEFEARRAAGSRRWRERVLVYRSVALAERKSAELDARLVAARDDLLALAPPVGPGRRQIASIDALGAAIDKIVAKHKVDGLLWPVWRSEPNPSRTDPDRLRFDILDVLPREDRITAARQALGWQVLVTNVPAEQLAFEQAVPTYNDAWIIERQFYTIKDRPLGIRPLFVQRDDQITGLTHLLILALRLLALIQGEVRRSLEQDDVDLAGLFESRPNRTTRRPTARRLLQAVHRSQITLTRVRGPGISQWHVTPLSPLVSNILHHLGLSHDIYTNLATSAQ